MTRQLGTRSGKQKRQSSRHMETSKAKNEFLIIQKSQLTSVPARNRESAKQTSVTEPLTYKRTHHKVEEISVKEAMKDREWMAKCREQIVKIFYCMINESNGVLVKRPSDIYLTYKYCIGKGNNAELVKQVLGSRWWWTRVPEEEKQSAHFIWTQWTEKALIKSIPCSSDIENTVDHGKVFSLGNFHRYSDPKRISRLSVKTVDLSPLGYEDVYKSSSYVKVLGQTDIDPVHSRTHNKLEENCHLSSKKGLFYNMKNYYETIGRDVFEVIPLTFHITSGVTDPVFIEFERVFCETGPTCWIVKPGENTNRGIGISLCSSLVAIKQEINKWSSRVSRTFIIQKYIDRPFLIHKRKFDIRCYALVTSCNGVLQGYFYSEGYLRTTSYNFSLANLDNKFVHLTNDAVQKKSESYGKYETGNKLSYSEFQKYLDTAHPELNVNFIENVLPAMKQIVKDTICSVFLKIDPNRRSQTFEIFGYDFLLDYELRPWLLEVNTNPCLELSSPQLVRIIPAMLDNSFRIALDPLFPEPPHPKKQSHLANEMIPDNKYELIFHSLADGLD